MRRSSILVTMCLIFCLGAGPATAGDAPAMTRDYLKDHYPEVYRQIYQEGREAGRLEALAPVTKVTAPEPTATPASGAVAKATAPAPAAEKKIDLGNWWEKSSLSYSPVPEQWLFHEEGTLDYKHKSGNTKSDRYDGSATFKVRKLRFTNTLYYGIDKEYTVQNASPGTTSSPTDSDYRNFQEALRYDLTARLYTEGGYIWEKDREDYISARRSYYAGVGYALIDTLKHHLEVFAAGGYVSEEYPSLIKNAMHLDHEAVTTAYFKEDYRWNITDTLTYKETFRIIPNLERTDAYNDDPNNLHVTGQTNRYRWFLINEIYFKLAAHLNFMTGCKIEYDSDPWPTVKKTDTTVKSGIQFSY